MYIMHSRKARMILNKLKDYTVNISALNNVNDIYIVLVILF